jgi:hypothetical protein
MVKCRAGKRIAAAHRHDREGAQRKLMSEHVGKDWPIQAGPRQEKSPDRSGLFVELTGFRAP